MDFTFGLGAGAKPHLEHNLGCSCQLRQGNCSGYCRFGLVLQALYASQPLCWNRCAAVSPQLLISILKLFVPLQFSNRGTSVAAYYNLEILLVVQVRFLLLKFSNLWLDLGFTAVAVTREFTVFQCSCIGFFWIGFACASLGVFMNTFQERSLASGRLNYNILDLVTVVFLAVCLCQYWFIVVFKCWTLLLLCVKMHLDVS